MLSCIREQQPGGRYNLAHFVPQNPFFLFISPSLFPGTKGIPAYLGFPMIYVGVNPFLLPPIIALLSLLCYYGSNAKEIASISQMRLERFLTRDHVHAMVEGKTFKSAVLL